MSGLDPKRPTWLPNGCPDWCGSVGDHPEYDHNDDRVHIGTRREVILTAARDEVNQESTPDQAEAVLSQHYREVQARIEVGFNEKPTGLTFTLDEADEFARELLSMEAEARDADGDFGHVHTSGHPAWCRDCVEDGGETVGHTHDVETSTGLVGLGSWEGEETKLLVRIDVELLTVGQAEELARVLLDAAADARKAGEVR